MKNILVFPCGSEIALELYRSLRYSTHFNLVGANSVDDHGKFVFEQYVGGLPFITDEALIPALIAICKKYNIDAIYPAMDLVIAALKKHETELGVKVIAPEYATCAVCASKSRTYKLFQNIIRTPKVYDCTENIQYPVFGKPDAGYGSRNTMIIRNKNMKDEYLNNHSDGLLLELLTGEEYTVDCFSNKSGELLFCKARKRQRIMNGISVNTVPVENNDEVRAIADKINSHMKLRGAWFFQVKRSSTGELCLLEIAARFGGSSSLFRGKGVNFALLTLFDAFDYGVEVIENDYTIELDRALDNIYKIDIRYNEVYMDVDDCIILNGKINKTMQAFICQCINRGIKIILLTRHDGDVAAYLTQFRIRYMFDDIIQISKNELKSKFICNRNSIFIDDSFAERKEVKSAMGVFVFSPDMVEGLLGV